MKKLILILLIIVVSSCGSFQPTIKNFEPKPTYEIRYNFYRSSLFWNFYFNSWGYNWNTPYFYRPFYLDYTFDPYWGSFGFQNTWAYWNRPYYFNQWNYYRPYYTRRGRSNVTHVNGYRNSLRTNNLVVSNRTRPTTTRSQIQYRTRRSTVRPTTRPTVRPTQRINTTRSTVRPTTTRNTTRSTSTRRNNIRRNN